MTLPEASREQGDINTTSHRKVYTETLSGVTQQIIAEDASYYLHQALSTPVMNVLAKTEGAWIEDLDGNRYLDLHGNGVHNAGFSNPDSSYFSFLLSFQWLPGQQGGSTATVRLQLQ